MMDKKFIIVNDEQTAKKFIAYGFKLISQIGNTYTFQNNAPKNFKFDAIEGKYCFSNILSL